MTMGYPVESLAPLGAATRSQIPARKIPARRTDLDEPVICNRTADRGSFGATSPEIEGPYAPSDLCSSTAQRPAASDAHTLQELGQC